LKHGRESPIMKKKSKAEKLPPKNRCKVTVRTFHKPDDEGEKWRMAQVDVKLRSRGEFETEVPELWTIRWTNLDQIIQENFWPFINKYCPEPDLVAEATQNCKLPEGLKDSAVLSLLMEVKSFGNGLNRGTGWRFVTP
jgi:hypothetical protein